jgi:hypothetical protein
LASTKPNAWILDPFAGSSTTGIAANLANRRYLGIDQDKSFLDISKNRKLEIEDPKTAELYKNKIAGFIDKKQYREYLQTENPKEEVKVAIGFCRAKDLNKLKNESVFYFHSIENGNRIKDFPTGIVTAEKLLIYSGGRSKPMQLSGLSADIRSIKQVHKSDIKGKENSKTEFYYEIKLESPFTEMNKLSRVLNAAAINHLFDEENKSYLQQSLPAITNWSKVIQLIK